MSIGAGSPKLRIWLTMSAGRNANVTPGNDCASTLRSVATYAAVDAWFGFSVISTSASPVPIGSDASYVRLIPLTGTPMLSSTPASWSAGITPRIFASTSSVSRAVSSIRVPVGARRCRRISPVSTDGKKSLPANANRPVDATQASRNAAAKRRRRAIAAASSAR